MEVPYLLIHETHWILQAIESDSYGILLSINLYTDTRIKMHKKYVWEHMIVVVRDHPVGLVIKAMLHFVKYN